MPTSVLYGSKRVYSPGVYTTTDSSALVQTSPESTGIVAILGESVGGKPYTEIESRADLALYPGMSQLVRDYPQGDLVEAANMAFAPAANLPGAAAVVLLKVNPATRARVTLNSAQGPSLTLTANTWGLSGNTIRVSIAAGLSAGSTTIALSQGEISETSGDLQNDPVAAVSYSPTGSWRQLSLAVDTTGITLQGQGTFADHAGDIAQQVLAAPAQVTLQAEASDVGKTVTLIGIDGSGQGLVEDVPLNSVVVQSVGTFQALLGLLVSDAALDIKAVDAASNVLAEITNNHTSAGVTALPDLAVAADVVSVKGNAGKVVVFGTSASGQRIAQVVTLSGGTYQATSGPFATIQGIASGQLAGGGNLRAKAGFVAAGGGTTVLAAKGALAGVTGLSVDVTDGDENAPVASLDALASTPLGTSPVSLVSDLEAIVDWVNANSVLVTAAAATGASGVPTPTDQPVYFQGGTETPSTKEDYIAAIGLLKKARVNIIASLSCDPAVTSALNEHCKYMWGDGQSERVFHAGAQDQSLSRPASRAEMFAQQKALNSGYAWLIPSGIIRFDTQGNLRRWQPQFTAVLLAGLRAGLPLGEPMTRKALDVVGIFNDRSWDALEDAEDLLSHGICFLRETDNVGVSVVRDITTWTRDGDETKSSGSIVFSLGYATYFYRLGLQRYVGTSGSAGTDGAITVQAISINQTLLNQRAILGFERPVLSRIGDAVYIDQEWNPTEETNFILPTLRLTRAAATAAGTGR